MKIAFLKFGRKSIRNQYRIPHIVSDVSRLLASGYRPIVISSGAMDRGEWSIAQSSPRAEYSKPTLAGFGTLPLFAAWEQALEPHGLHAAPLLVTHANLKETSEASSIRRYALEVLDGPNGILIANENDPVSPVEISYMERGLGENDRLTAALVSLLRHDVQIECVYLSTHLGGYFTANPEEDEQAKLVRSLSFASYDKGALLRVANPVFANGVRNNDITAKIYTAFECQHMGVPNVAIGPYNGFWSFLMDRERFNGTVIVP